MRNDESLLDPLASVRTVQRHPELARASGDVRTLAQAYVARHRRLQTAILTILDAYHRLPKKGGARGVGPRVRCGSRHDTGGNYAVRRGPGLRSLGCRSGCP